MDQRPNRVGQQLGNYRLERLLGRGGFADVYLGHHVRLKRESAIKILHAYLSEKEVEDFQREAQIIAALDHPNIVRILDFDVQDGLPFLVMDYLPNGTLRQRHERGQRLPLPTVVSYVKQVADALQYAHDQRLIHRDVKPENMLIGRRNEIVLSDFGIAAIAHSTSSMTAQASVGTIPYMAPEQIQAHARAASDQYALGIVVYEWLSGERPFTGSYTEIFAKHLMTPPLPLREKVPTLSADVERVVMTALAKDSQQRFRCVQAFAVALEQASQPRQMQPSQPPREDTLSSRVLQSTNPVTPLQPSTPVMKVSPSIPFSSPIVPRDIGTQPARPTRRLSRRVVIAGVVGLTILGGGLTWLVTAHGSASQAPHRSPTPTPLPLGTLLYTYRGHSGFVATVVWSPDGKRIASGSQDKTVQVWDAADGNYPLAYRGHSNQVIAIEWSPDGKRIASGAEDKTVQVWNAVDGRNVFTYQGHSSEVWAVAWSPDGKRIASGARDKTVKVWNAVDGANVYTYHGHTDAVRTLAWSPDGKRIASGSYDKTVQVWDAVDGTNVYTYPGHNGDLFVVEWSPDGKRVASGSADKTVQVWDATNGGNVYTYRGHTDYVRAVVWSPDGKRVASGSADKTVQVWDATNGGNVYTYHGHTDAVRTLAWSLYGKRLASGSADKTVQVWAAP